MAEKYLAVEEVASLLNITNAEVIAATTSGQLRGYKDGSAWKFRQEDVERYIADQRNSNSSFDDDDYGYGEDYDLEINDNDVDVAGSSDINNTLDKDVTLLGEESGIELVDDDEGDLVLGEDDGVGGGSLSEESGISLLSATDSGISLDDNATGEVLELGEDDLAMGSSILTGSLAASLSVTGEENFTLTTNDDEYADDDESGSQVIMIDDDDMGMDDFAPMDSPGMEDAGEGFDDIGAEADEALAPVLDPSLYQLPEKPYGVWSVVGLIFCTLLLILAVIFLVDLTRSVGSAYKPTAINSAIMDWVVENFAK
ncbi:MAG: helix-turn-helix domain-containing protein [Planctomycetia bacterium]|nr:helix-turn-helix domain-containing protein [Planctomycetia bacterium]